MQKPQIHYSELINFKIFMRNKGWYDHDIISQHEVSRMINPYAAGAQRTLLVFKKDNPASQFYTVSHVFKDYHDEFLKTLEVN